MDSDIEVDLEQNLNQDIIQTRYVAYVERIRIILEGQGISAGELSSYLLLLQATGTISNNMNVQLLSDLKLELQQAEKVSDIFTALSARYHFFLDYSIFENVYQHFGANEAHKDLRYPEHVQNYLKLHKINKFVKHFPEMDHPKLDQTSTKVNIKFDIKSTESMSTLKEATGTVANILGLNPFALRLRGIKKGYMLVTFFISSFIVNSIFTSETVFTEEQRRSISVVAGV